MSDKQVDLLRRDECQPLTTEQMTNIKSQFHPSNTANVNIMAYHIYDEDEHVVGEWRETIDGVKKKKPVYEKTIPKIDNIARSTTNAGTVLSLASIGINNVDYFIRFYGGTSLVPKYTTYTGADSVNYFAEENNFYTQIMKTYTMSGKWSIGIKCNFTSGNVRLLNMTFQYTKTTDEWQPV